MSHREDAELPIGPLPELHISDDDTDPQPFRDNEVTKRRCGTCGAEIGPDESATRRGEIAVYEKVYAFLVSQNVSPVAAARTVEAIRKHPV